MQPGRTLFIRGGTSLAAQLAYQAGLPVLATTRDPTRTTLLTANGAAHALTSSIHTTRG